MTPRRDGFSRVSQRFTINAWRFVVKYSVAPIRHGKCPKSSHKLIGNFLSVIRPALKKTVRPSPFRQKSEITKTFSINYRRRGGTPGRDASTCDASQTAFWVVWEHRELRRPTPAENLRRNSSKYLGKLCRLVRQCRLHKDCRLARRPGNAPPDALAVQASPPGQNNGPESLLSLPLACSWFVMVAPACRTRRWAWLSGFRARRPRAGRLVGRRLPGPADRARTVESDRRSSAGTARRHPLGGQRADRKR